MDFPAQEGNVRWDGGRGSVGASAWGHRLVAPPTFLGGAQLRPSAQSLWRCGQCPAQGWHHRRAQHQGLLPPSGPHLTPEAALAQVPGTAPAWTGPWEAMAVPAAGSPAAVTRCRVLAHPRRGSRAGGRQGGWDTGPDALPRCWALSSPLLARGRFPGPGTVYGLPAAAAS